MIWIGVFLGLGSALGHSLAYLATRWFTHDRGRSSGQLLALAHVMLGVIGGLSLLVLWPTALRIETGWFLRMLALVGFFVIGHSCLILSLRWADASRVAPLLGAKVAVLAVIAVVLGSELVVMQWVGVAMAVAAAWVLNGVGGRLPWRVTGLMSLACVSYAISDTFILATITEVRRISGDDSVMGVPLFVAAGAYSMLGVIGLGLLPRFGTRDAGAWRDALPYVGSWVLAMMTLYATFAAVGTVLGAILQSSRGLISIFLGIGLAAMGWHHLEQKHGWGVQVRRLGAAALMCLAVYLYVMGGR